MAERNQSAGRQQNKLYKTRIDPHVQEDFAVVYVSSPRVKSPLPTKRRPQTRLRWYVTFTAGDGRFSFHCELTEETL